MSLTNRGDTIADPFWAEIGVDASRYQKLLLGKRKDRFKALSLSKSLTIPALNYVKNKFGLSGTSEYQIAKNLVESNIRAAIEIFVIIKSYKQFSNIKKFYVDHINQGNENDPIYCMLRLYYENKPVLKELAYSTLLQSKESMLDTYTLKVPSDFSVSGMDTLSIKQMQKLAWSCLKTKTQRQKINVWYILPQDDVMTIFIFKKASSRAKLANPNARKYRFIAMAKPIIMQFSKNGKQVSLYSKEKARTIEMATGIISSLGGRQIGDPLISYDKEVVVNKKSVVDAFIKKITKTQSPKLELQQTRVLTNQDPYLLVYKKSQPIHALLEDVSKRYADSELNADNVPELTVYFGQKSFQIFVTKDDRGTNGYQIEYRTRAGHEIRKRFEQTMKSEYDIELSKRG